MSDALHLAVTTPSIHLPPVPEEVASALPVMLAIGLVAVAVVLYAKALNLVQAGRLVGGFLEVGLVGCRPSMRLGMAFGRQQDSRRHVHPHWLRLDPEPLLGRIHVQRRQKQVARAVCAFCRRPAVGVCPRKAQREVPAV